MVGIINLLFWDGKGKGFCHKIEKRSEKLFRNGCFS